LTEPASYRTAISRGDFSRPTKLILELALLSDGDTFLDYGCGRGEDVDGLRRLGFHATGWDPHYRPDAAAVDADVVNLGYVANVIADPEERRAALRSAWQHAAKALVVAARLNAERRTISLGRPHGDGFLTGNGTFQRFYGQAELRQWIDSTLGVESVAVAPGIFVVFRREEAANEFLMRTRRRRVLAVRITRADRLFELHRDVLDELMRFFTERGRLPGPAENGLAERLQDSVGSVRRAWTVIERAAPTTDWGAIVCARSSDLLVDLALLRLNRRPTFNALPDTIRRDIKALFGSYAAATLQADELLFSAGDPESVSKAASDARVGKRLPTALYVHESGLPLLPPVLRTYEGCARWLVGDVEGANVVKLATDKPKVSYLSYPDFDTDAHPRLAQATYVRLRGLDVDSRSYTASANPPVLHRKEQFVREDHPRYATFARLTAQEERFGLLGEDTKVIGNLDGWMTRLDEVGVEVHGHRVVRRRGQSSRLPSGSSPTR
jgi:DNA phosphorothioation-associated putative methyltransferase